MTRQEEPLSCRALPMLQLCWPESQHHSHDFQCHRRPGSEHPPEEPVSGARLAPDDRSFMIGGPTIEPSSSERLNSAYVSPMMRQAQEKHRSPLRIERYTRSDITTVAQCGTRPNLVRIAGRHWCELKCSVATMGRARVPCVPPVALRPQSRPGKA